MEVISVIETFNEALEKSYFFRGFKFVLGFYLIIMTATIILMLKRMMGFAYFTVLKTGQDTPVIKGQMQKRWEEAESKLNSFKPEQWRLSILEVAEILEETLEISGFGGETLSDKLEGMNAGQLSNLEQLKESNKIRQKIIEDGTFMLNQDDAKRVVDVFAEALESFETITRRPE